MKIQLSILFIFSGLLWTSCSRIPSETKEFRDYLKQMGIMPENGVYYLLVPSNQCKNCVMLNSSSLGPGWNEKIRVISSLSREHFINFRHYYQDKDDVMLGLKLVDYENKLLYYSNDRIEWIMNPQIISTTDSICETD